jgi:CRP-like cAMP-binding protein
MYVIQEGQVEILLDQEDGKEIRLSIRGAGEIIGEMAIFDREERSATVRALGQARLLTVDKKNFLRRIHSDPSLALRIVETMSQRIRALNAEVARLKKDL